MGTCCSCQFVNSHQCTVQQYLCTMYIDWKPVVLYTIYVRDSGVMMVDNRVHLTLIYVALGPGTLWHSQIWMAISPKVPMYKNSETICIPCPMYCLLTYAFKFIKQWCFHKFLSTFFYSGIEYSICTQGAMQMRAFKEGYQIVVGPHLLNLTF